LELAPVTSSFCALSALQSCADVKPQHRAGNLNGKGGDVVNFEQTGAFWLSYFLSSTA
jgi:hypothetical protein